MQLGAIYVDRFDFSDHHLFQREVLLPLYLLAVNVSCTHILDEDHVSIFLSCLFDQMFSRSKLGPSIDIGY